MMMLKPVHNWRRAAEMHSVQLCVFWAAMNGAVIGLAAFVDVFNPWIFLGLNVAGYALVAVGRLLRQPGLD